MLMYLMATHDIKNKQTNELDTQAIYIQAMQQRLFYIPGLPAPLFH